MKKLLIITYYWPPAGGPGVQRILKFAKYLPDFGWLPLILTVTDGEYAARDESLIKEIPEAVKIFKTPSLEPFRIYKKFVGISEEKSVPTAVLAEKEKNWKQKIANWFRINFFIPDAKIGWMPYAVLRGKKIIKEFNPDIIFSTSPPPTVHLIAHHLNKHSGIKWVADFRDPWTEIHYYENQNRLAFADYLDKCFEKKILKAANSIVAISQLDIETDFAAKSSPEKCWHIPNGFDEHDFEGFDFRQKSGKKFILLHLGAIGKERNPINLFKVIAELAKSNRISTETFTLRLIGNIENEIRESIASEKISEFVEFNDYLPHIEALSETVNASAMLLLVTQSEKNKRILPGKTFEYMRTLRPILALGPEKGEVDRILSETGCGIMIEYQNKEKIYNYLLKMINDWREGNYLNESFEFIKKYERKNLTGELVKIFENLL